MNDKVFNAVTNLRNWKEVNAPTSIARDIELVLEALIVTDFNYDKLKESIALDLADAFRRGSEFAQADGA